MKMKVLSVNVDSMEELYQLRILSHEMNQKVDIGIRLGLDDGSQFGLDVASGKAADACRYLAENSNYFKLVCVHCHTVANAQNSKLHLRYIRKALNFIKYLRSEHDFELPYLDIGGGFDVPTSMIMSRLEYALYRLFGALPPRPSGKEYQSLEGYICDAINLITEFCRDHSLTIPKLIIEPGRVIVSRAETLLTRVNGIKVKSNGLHYALTDAGRHSIAYPCDYEYHEILAANKLNQFPAQFYHLVGRICTRAIS